MPIKAELLPHEPIIIIHFLPPFTPVEDLSTATQHTANALQETGSVLYRIENLTRVEIDFGQMVSGLAQATAITPGSMRDPNVLGILVSQQEELFTIVANAFKQEQYGMRDVSLFATVDEALAYARAQIAAQS